MSEVNDERFCPICQQIIPIEDEAIKIVRKFPGTKTLLHQGCAKEVYEAYNKFLLENSSQEDYTL